jgi:hypothetical protein
MNSKYLKSLHKVQISIVNIKLAIVVKDHIYIRKFDGITCTCVVNMVMHTQLAIATNFSILGTFENDKVDQKLDLISFVFVKFN